MVHKMEVDKASYEKITSMISKLASSSVELECRFKENVNKDAFTRMIQYCRSTGMNETVNEDQLDVFCNLPSSPSNIRVSITGKDAISDYCRTNKLPDNVIMVIKKSINGVKSVMLKEINFKVDMKDEMPLNDISKEEVLTRLPLLDKGYRYKKRFSYEDKNVRYDFSIVKTSVHRNANFVCHKGFATSGIVSASEAYEVEIEYMPVIKKGRIPPKPDAIANNLIQAMATMYMIYMNESQYIPITVRKEALHNYLKLAFGTFDKDLLDKAPRSYFAAPQPVTLERKNLYKPDLGVVSILDNYTVTEKADGERCLLFVNSDGRCFFIDSRLNMKFTGVKLNNLVNTLLDGELITKDKFGNKINMFGAFDIYYYNSADVKSLPLVEVPSVAQSSPSYFSASTPVDPADLSVFVPLTPQSPAQSAPRYSAASPGKNNRYAILCDVAKRFATRFKEEGDLELFAKEFKYGAGIFGHSAEVLKSEARFPYKIDGLIYTPAYLPVGALFEGQNVTTPYVTWERVFKYKPPEENTVDFLVKYGANLASEGVIKKELMLYVGYNPMHWERITADDYIQGTYTNKRGYVEKRFEPADDMEHKASSAFVKEEADKTIRCINGDMIENNTIVECAWLNEEWVPVRVRKDKTELYKKQGVSRTANDLKNAMSIWRTLRFPVTVEMITGAEALPVPVVGDLDEDAYYFRELPRDKMATKTMLDFHNYWIKNVCLIKRYGGRKLFDIACGQAGDLNKWIDVGIKQVFGVDYSKDNIENPISGAYARTIRKFDKLKKLGMQIMYLALDAGELMFNDNEFNAIKDDKDKDIARALWGAGFKPSNNKKLMQYYNFVQRESFDVVSCQFAIHYFFENDKKLGNLVKNVAAHLAPGGHFIGTCLDGKKIKEAFEKEGTTELTGRKGNRVIWNIRKIGDDEIEVYMESIGRRIRERLVDFDRLTAELAKYEIVPAAPITSFETEWNRMKHDQTIDPYAKSRMAMMSDVEKKYSFFNVYFVYQKLPNAKPFFAHRAAI